MAVDNLPKPPTPSTAPLRLHTEQHATDTRDSLHLQQEVSRLRAQVRQLQADLAAKRAQPGAEQGAACGAPPPSSPAHGSAGAWQHLI